MDYSQLSTLILNLTIVLLLIFAIFYVKKLKFKSNNKGKPIQLIHTLAVGQKERLILVEINQTELLIGVTPNNIQTLYTYNKLVDGENSFTEFLKTNAQPTNIGETKETGTLSS